MKIRKYKKEDENNVMGIIKKEGEEWESYSGLDVQDKYKKALKNSITYVAYVGDELCGYSRSLDDNGFFVYVCDLLVTPKFRGKNIGRELMECIYKDYPDKIIYVMSDVDKYYEKQGYRKEGSVFEVLKDRE